MFGKLWTVAVAVAITGALALPAPAAYAQTTPAPAPAPTKPAAKPATMAKPMKKSAHKMDCYDYAWQSAAMNDCLAKGTSKAGSDGMSKPVKKASKKKKTPA